MIERAAYPLDEAGRLLGGISRGTFYMSDVYGSRFITAGAGSVIALNGGSGDPVIDLRQLKQPDEEVGPLRVLLDFSTGEMTINYGTDILEVVNRTPDGIAAMDAARILYDTDKPTNSDRERARRKLNSLAEKGLVAVRKSDERTEPDRYVSVIQSRETEPLDLAAEGVHGKVHAGGSA